ncbi:lipocalin family protein [Algoriphagus sp. Y33]|uniref:lipocalin family protein n=1 Tax=Algoriphagus sp. Y33 TaxID=2772483 RepID=UPI001781F9A0|nr:lipocalin family protein [Algoriphagus sp. Y33]
MKPKLLPLLAILLVFFSCNDVTEVSPNIRISGVYESTREAALGDGETKYDLVDKLIFKADGTFTGENITLSGGTDEILGYRAVYSGTYTVSEQKVAITYEDPLEINMRDIYYIPKDALTLMEGVSYSLEYAVSDSYSRLSIICPEFAKCAPPVPYIKVD